MRTIDLAEKTALITGASQGLGAATARVLHGAGGNVIVNYWADPEGINQTRANQLVSELGTRAIAVEADVRDQEAVKQMFDAAIQEFGSLEMVINNAGIIRDRTVAKMSAEEWQAVIDTNLTGVFLVSKQAGISLSDGGRIVNLASISAVVGTFGQANYVAAKAGVIGLTRVLSREMARRKINVNAVAPGVVLTEMGQSIPEKALDQMKLQVPLGRFCEPEEIANVILFLCSDLSTYLTGQTLHVNGGWWG
ncbi:MAG: SDR family oxidoreductase [Planctomycetaceae bacterium]|nr:SDR family oxidoreductase [Planctomycetaceae bacterium]